MRHWPRAGSLSPLAETKLIADFSQPHPDSPEVLLKISSLTTTIIAPVSNRTLSKKIPPTVSDTRGPFVEVDVLFWVMRRMYLLFRLRLIVGLEDLKVRRRCFRFRLLVFCGLRGRTTSSGGEM